MGKLIDLTGQRFGRLLVLERIPNYRDNYTTFYKCQCSCGKIATIRGTSLSNNDTKSCGCYHLEQIKKPRTNLKGKRFGKLKVLDRGADYITPSSGRKRATWRCRCKCGVIKVFLQNTLRANKNISCGCSRSHLPKGCAAFNRVLAQYKNQAKRAGRNFRLSKEQFREMTKQNCYYCGVVSTTIKSTAKSYGHYTYNGIDRIDNSKGYMEGNVVPCCEWCNRMKLDHSQEKFLEQIKRIYEHSVKGK